MKALAKKSLSTTGMIISHLGTEIVYTLISKNLMMATVTKTSVLSSAKSLTFQVKVLKSFIGINALCERY